MSRAFPDAYFIDAVSGKPVYEFVDTLGRWWMAEHRWALFRVSIQPRGALTVDARHE